ncbi:alpha-L-rhamnosidase C-terminal domain-containing protein [Miniimonas arenae]|uniref:alpha-L-rhamnosidase-related protein n=1 Tax=Miniimonas arenae TaxID=676201 RepID=UPI0015D59F7F
MLRAADRVARADRGRGAGRGVGGFAVGHAVGRAGGRACDARRPPPEHHRLARAALRGRASDEQILREQLARTSSAFVAHAFLVWSARLLARVERVVGDVALAVAADLLAEEVAARTWARWREHALGTQTGCALAIELGVAPEAEHAVVGDRLAALVRSSDGRIATGFLGTPHVLPALTRTGHDAEAYLMLLRDEPPSWLYQVRQGATTVWERWDAIRADGSIHDGRMAQGDVMLSFNHYAYSAVIDWACRHVAGLAPDPTDPGYRTLVVAPRPARALGRARASVLTSFGRAAVAWWADGEDLLLDVEVPFYARARLDLAVSARSRVEVVSGGEDGPVHGRVIRADAVLPAGAHRIVVRRARFADVSVGGGGSAGAGGAGAGARGRVVSGAAS